MTRAAPLPLLAVLMIAWPAAARTGTRTLHVALCGGGTVDLPIGGGGRPGDDDHGSGCVTACHAVLGNRKRSG